jgi:hypothetical protein
VSKSHVRGKRRKSASILRHHIPVGLLSNRLSATLAVLQKKDKMDLFATIIAFDLNRLSKFFPCMIIEGDIHAHGLGMGRGAGISGWK